MPYCPKCDMEFVEGITVCSDCGGPLMESEEAYKEELKRQREEALERRRMEAQREFTIEELFPEDEKLDSLSDPDWARRAGLEPDAERDSAAGQTDGTEREAAWNALAEEAAYDPLAGASKPRAAAKPVSSGVYVTMRQRCEDMRSSASAFLLVGGAMTVFAVLCWAGIVRLPMGSGSKTFFQLVLTAMGLVSLGVSFKTRSSAAALQKKAAEEERCTTDLITWFTDTWTGAQLDEELLREDPSLFGPELELKRFELIQDHLITGQDLPNQSYVEFLSEEIYGRLYQEENGEETDEED